MSEQGRSARVLMIYADSEMEWNCSQWRIVNPAYGLRKIGVQVDLMFIADWVRSISDKQIAQIVDNASVVLLQRNVFGGALKALRFWRERGKRIYVDLDDAYQILPESNGAHEFWNTQQVWNAPGETPLDELREGIAISSGLTSPSRVILGDWDAPAKIWLPNYVRGEWYRDFAPRVRDGWVIGWGGSMSHYDSMRYSGAMEALRRVCAERRDVRVVICGNDRRIYDMLKGVRAQQKMYQPGVPPDEWPRVLARFDLGIAPLFGEYDRRRSWLKAIEYACAGVPCLVTDSDPYAGLDEWVHRTPNGVDEWEMNLHNMIKDIMVWGRRAVMKRRKALDLFSIESNARVWASALLGDEWQPQDVNAMEMAHVD